MKKNYDPTKLSKKQRHMKKWIPNGVYCHGMGKGKHSNYCPFWHGIWNECMKDKTYGHKRSCPDDNPISDYYDIGIMYKINVSNDSICQICMMPQ